MALIPSIPSIPPPLIPKGIIDKPSKKLDDVLVQDESVPLSQLLQEGGWGAPSSSLNRTARGVIKCESNFNPVAYNRTPCATGENAVGLMQICTVHKGTMGIPATKDEAIGWLKNPRNNVRVGKAVYQKQGWGAWACPTTSTNEDPKINVKKGTASGIVGNAIDDATGGLLSPLAALVDFFGLLTQASTWLRVGKVILGASLLGAGVMVVGVVATKEVILPVAKEVSPAGKITKVASKATKAGKAAKVVK